MAAPTNAALVKKSPCQPGAVQTWPVAADFAPQPNVRFSAESDITEKQRPLVYELRRAGCDSRPANAKE